MKRFFLLLAPFLFIGYTQKVNALPFANRGNETIDFKFQSGSGARPPGSTGNRDAVLTCSRSFGRTKTGIGSKTVQLIKFDQSLIDKQLPSPAVNVAFKWGDSKSSTGSYGTIGKMVGQHVLNLGTRNVFGVGFRGYINAVDGKYFTKQVGENGTDMLALTPDNSFVSRFEPRGVKAKCPEMPRREFSACELSGGC
jgi:hypothetical protein